MDAAVVRDDSVDDSDGQLLLVGLQDEIGSLASMRQKSTFNHDSGTMGFLQDGERGLFDAAIMGFHRSHHLTLNRGGKSLTQRVRSSQLHVEENAVEVFLSCGVEVGVDHHVPALCRLLPLDEGGDLGGSGVGAQEIGLDAMYAGVRRGVDVNREEDIGLFLVGKPCPVSESVKLIVFTGQEDFGIGGGSKLFRDAGGDGERDEFFVDPMKSHAARVVSAVTGIDDHALDVPELDAFRFCVRCDGQEKKRDDEEKTCHVGPDVSVVATGCHHSGQMPLMPSLTGNRPL